MTAQHKKTKTVEIKTTTNQKKAQIENRRIERMTKWMIDYRKKVDDIKASKIAKRF